MKDPVVVLLCLVLVLVPHAAPVAAEEDEGMWARLKRLDTDGDGRVTREELGRRSRMLDRFDKDGDGVISKAEAMAVPMQAGSRGRGDGRGEGRRGNMRGGGLGLERLDLDKDGSVSKREWSAWFEKADENADGILQPAEWDAATRGRPLRDDAPQEGAKAPQVSAVKKGTQEAVDLAAVKRTTVLIFGSWT